MSNQVRNCHRCGRDFSAPYKECLCEECLKDLGWDSTPMSNADRIRAMSDEGLAKMLATMVCIHAPESEYMQTWLDWLKQPAKEDA